MTATEKLRELLDERGVEHDDSFGATEFYGEGDSVVVAFNSKSRNAVLYVNAYLTPEQAVEATLGRGTCHITVEDNLAETEGMGDVWLECSACHWQMLLEPTTPLFGYCPPLFSYCPNCGRRVVDA